MQAVILAAGESSRFWPLNKKHKSLLKMKGKPLISYTIESLKKAGIKDIIIIQSPEKDVQQELENYFSNMNINYVVQEEPKGMGNALWQARSFLKDKFLVLNPERIDICEILSDFQFKEPTLFGQKTETPELYGIARLEGNKVLDIVEKPEKGKEPSDIKVLGIYLLDPKFFEIYEKVEKHMYDFEDALSKYMKKYPVKFKIVEKTEKETLSLKYPWHLFNIRKNLLDRKENYVDETAKIEKNVVIENCYIGKNVKVFENSVLKNSYIGDNTIVGNSSLVRDSIIEKDCLIGAHSEIAKCLIQEDVHLHSGFIGDSIIDRGCRIGAGIITGNVRIDRGKIWSLVKGKKVNTNLKSFGCVVGENTRFGIRVSTMPGNLIGSNCIIGPSTMVKKNIPNNTRYYFDFEKGVVEEKLI